MKPQVSVLPDALELRDSTLFGDSDSVPVLSLARRVLGVREVSTLLIDPAHGKVKIGFHLDPGKAKDFLATLVAATRTEQHALAASEIPAWNPGESAHWIKCQGRIAAIQTAEPQAGQLTLNSPLLGDPDQAGLRTRVIDSLTALPGVSHVDPISLGQGLHIHYDPEKLTSGQLLKAIESALVEAPTANPPIAVSTSVPMTVSSTTVGLGAVGELLMPVATPLAAGVLIATNLGVVRDAAAQLTRGKVGVPLFHTALLTCSIVTGQVLAFALTDWSLRYWQRRWRKQIVNEFENLTGQSLPAVDEIRTIDAGGTVSNVAFSLVREGLTVRVLAGEPVPVDGRVTAGEALLDEKAINGAPLPVRKSVGDEVLTGSLLLAGGLDIAVTRAQSEARSGRIAEAIGRTATGIAADMVLKKKAETMADKTALPTLATAGVGWVAGDLITVGAILHQDWVSGPALAVPLLTLRNVASALQYGAVVQNPSAFTRIADCDFVVLDGDDPALAACPLEVSEIRSKLPENTDMLLRHVAGAGLYLGGDMAQALLDACRSRDLVVRQTDLLALEPSGVLVQVGESRLHLTLGGNPDAPIIAVELNGKDVAEVQFKRGAVPLAAAAVRKFAEDGLQVFMLSSAQEAETGRLAASLGVSLSGSEITPAERIRFLDGLKRRGVKALYVGRLRQQPEINAHVSATIAIENLEDGGVPADVVMVGGRYDGVPTLLDQARGYEPDIRQSTRMATIPNLLCVAGGFGGVLNGITSGIIANVGVMNVDRHIQRKLAVAQR